MPELDARCENWGRWARPDAAAMGPARGGVPPVPKEWDPEWGDPYEFAPETRPPPPDGVDGLLIDRAVSRIAEQHRQNLVLFYIKMQHVPIGPYYAALRALNDRLLGRFHEVKHG